MEPLDPLMLVLPRPEIEALNLPPFLRRFGVNALPKGAELGALMGAFNFIVHGYYRKLREKWPYWFSYDFRTEGLLIMTLCCLNEVSGVNRAAGTDAISSRRLHGDASSPG